MSLIRAIYILKLCECRSRLKRRRDLRRELSLPVYQRADLTLSLLKAAQIDKAIIQPSQDGIIERTGDLFTVTGDKRDGIAVVDERDGFLCLSLTDAELVG